MAGLNNNHWINYECKARCLDLDRIEQLLLKLNADYKGEDHQIDTYFETDNGRFKLREGNIENALIFYQRQDIAGAKVSDISYYQSADKESLNQVLTKALNVICCVDKRRKIFFIDNVKFHLDRIEDLGTFVEIEAIGMTESDTIDKLKKQCAQYIEMFGIQDDDFVADSYVDMVRRKSG